MLAPVRPSPCMHDDFSCREWLVTRPRSARCRWCTGHTVCACGTLVIDAAESNKRIKWHVRVHKWTRSGRYKLHAFPTNEQTLYRTVETLISSKARHRYFGRCQTNGNQMVVPRTVGVALTCGLAAALKPLAAAPSRAS